MNILVDAAMPYWADYFSTLGNVTAFKAGCLTDYPLDKVNVLLVRSTTKVNKALLAKMPALKFVGTATAGYDHLDVDALDDNNIVWTAAGGCNASAVTQYVVCALLHLACEDDFLLSSKQVAIVGSGNVGKRVKASLLGLGVKVISYDPPLAYAQSKLTKASADDEMFVSFDEVVASDIICVHTPLNSEPQFPSLHMFNAETLNKLSDKQYLLNAGRGEVIDTAALLQIKQSNPHGSVNVILDVWENEPTIDRALIPFCRITTAHIAGHTLDGKAMGTHILYEKLCAQYNIKEKVVLSNLLPDYKLTLPSPLNLRLHNKTEQDLKEIQETIKEVCFCVYDIVNDDSVFRHYMAQSASFAELRRQYPIRREFSASNVDVSHDKIQELLSAIGFIISNSRTNSTLN